MSDDVRNSAGISTAKSAVALTVRQMCNQGIGIALGIYLARTLTPGEFGVYAIATFFFTLLVSIGDLGLGASLVRDELPPSPTNVKTVFTFRQSVDAVVFGIVMVLLSVLSQLYGLVGSDRFLFLVVALASCIFTFQAMPTVLLERKLSFGKIAVVEVTQTIVQAVALFLMIKAGVGVIAFGYSWLAFALTGAFLANMFQRWPIGWELHRSELRDRLPFALPYQGTHLLTLLKDGVAPIFVGVLLGTTAVGYINWAQMLAFFPIFFVLVLHRVLFPAFSRLEGDKDSIAVLLENVLFATNALIAPCSMLLLVLSTPITEIVFGAKWLPALSLFYVLWGVNLILPNTMVLQSLLNSLGRSRAVFLFSLCVALGTWVLAVPLVATFGGQGYVVAVLVVQFLSLWFVMYAKKHVAFSLARNMAGPWLSALLMGGVVVLCRFWYTVDGVLDIIVVGIVGMFLNYALLFCFESRRGLALVAQMMDRFDIYKREYGERKGAA